MKFSLIKNTYIKLLLSLISFVLISFFLFNIEVLAQKDNDTKNSIEGFDLKKEKDSYIISNDNESEEKVLISQNITYLSPNVISRLKNRIKKEENNIILKDNSFSLPNTVLIDFKNSIEKDNLKYGINNNDNKIRYVVKINDTIESIAKKFGVTVSTIKVENNIVNNKLREKQVLNILPVSGFIYKIRSGDTISSIALRYGIRESDLHKYNFFDNDKDGNPKIKINQKILIPIKDYYRDFSVKKRIVNTNSKTQSKKRYSVVNKNNNKTFKKKVYNPVKTSVSGRGYYTNPAPGSIKTQGIHGRNAVDLASRGHKHIAIVAAASGKVERARRTNGYYGGYGMNVLISHSNGSKTLYAHMSKVIVYNGQYVKKGQVIGYMGNTGRSTGVHLHFEIRNGGRNPF